MLTQPNQSLAFVVGQGRSGTSLVSEVLRRLGFVTPRPEVPPDPSNPRGFNESQSVVALHNRLLGLTNTAISDPRPDAPALTASRARRYGQQRARRLLSKAFQAENRLLIKDPRSLWFIDSWREATQSCHAQFLVVVPLRHPTEVVRSSSNSYGLRQGDAARVAGWINTMLHVEAATRTDKRVFPRHELLISEPDDEIYRIAHNLDLTEELCAVGTTVRQDLIEPRLYRSRADWDEVECPASLIRIASSLWENLNHLADDPHSRRNDAFDEIRLEYDALMQLEPEITSYHPPLNASRRLAKILAPKHGERLAVLLRNRRK